MITSSHEQLLINRRIRALIFFFFVAETKGTMDSLNLRPIEQAKISCAKKLFNEMSTSNVKYHDVDSYQNLLNVMKSLRLHNILRTEIPFED